ncbi:MAG: bacteriohemerythrin [Rhodospirillaceae bacterium]|nr:bacteriohemerythrin [Rhodospirillaceae bacterium]
MPYIAWRNEMEIGVPMIDADHKVLIALLNQIHSCLGHPEERTNMDSVLSSLLDYTAYHFRREEIFQEAVGYPGLAKHRAEHESLTIQVEELNHRYRLQPDSVRARDLLTFLKRWLIDHILIADMAFKPYAQGRRDAEQAAQAAIDIRHLCGDIPPEVLDLCDLSVLIVDDSDNFRTLMSTILGAIGIGTVITARYATEGLGILSRQAVDAVITDAAMTEMSGVDFISLIRSSPDPLMAQAAILMISGLSGDVIRRLALDAGADHFMEKPISASVLIAAIGATVTRRRRLVP